MSVPFVEITCERCDFRGSSRALRGDFAYRHDGREISLWRDLGWCPDCDGIRAVESPPASADIERMRGHVRQLDGRIESAREQARDRRRGLSRLLRLPPRSPHLRELQRTRDAALESLQTAEWLQYLFRQRRSGPRCLACGSENAYVLEERLETVRPDSSGPEVLTTSHPGCGGRFRVCLARMDNGDEPARVMFDIEGRRL